MLGSELWSLVIFKVVAPPGTYRDNPDLDGREPCPLNVGTRLDAMWSNQERGTSAGSA